MSMVVYKYPLPFILDVPSTHAMPRGARVLTCQIQNNTVCIWAAVDTQMPMDNRSFQIVPTGVPSEAVSGNLYVGTVQDGPLVWHIFEVMKPI